MPTELRLVATYMRRILDYKPKLLREKLYIWCEEHIEGYKKEKYYKIINSSINKACKKGSTLIDVESIKFNKSEMDYITNLYIVGESGSDCESIFSYDCKKLLFTLLFRMKVNKYITEMKSDDNFTYKGKYFQGGQKKYNELKKLANISDKVRINEDLINTLWINGLVIPMFNGLIKLDFMDNIYELISNVTKDDIAIEIKDYDNIGWYFDYYNKDSKIQFCKECGKIFKKKNNRQEYCSEECAKNADREKAKQRMKNIRLS